MRALATLFADKRTHNYADLLVPMKRPKFKGERTCPARGAQRHSSVPGVFLALMFSPTALDGLIGEHGWMGHARFNFAPVNYEE